MFVVLLDCRLQSAVYYTKKTWPIKLLNPSTFFPRVRQIYQNQLYMKYETVNIHDTTDTNSFRPGHFQSNFHPGAVDAFTRMVRQTGRAFQSTLNRLVCLGLMIASVLVEPQRSALRAIWNNFEALQRLSSHRWVGYAYCIINITNERHALHNISAIFSSLKKTRATRRRMSYKC